MTLFKPAMLLTNTFLLTVVKTNSGPTPLKGAKTTQQKVTKGAKTTQQKSTTGSKTTQQKSATGSKTKQKNSTAITKTTQQKNTSRAVQTSKPAPRVEKPLSEEEKLIQAAEKYHQQISGRKTQTVDQQKAGSTNVAPQAGSQQIVVPKPVISTKTAPPASQQKYVAPSNNTLQDVQQKAGKNSKTIPQSVQQKAGAASKFSVSKVQQKSTSQNKANAVVLIGEQEDGSGRDLSVNIYTGNPGIYRTEGDTLNFWSFTPVVADPVTMMAAVEPPGKPYGFEGNKMPATGQDWSFFLVLIGWSIFASLRFGFSKYIVHVFQSIFNYSVATRLYRERGYSGNFGMFRLNLIFFLFVPFPIYLIAKDNGVSMGGFSGFEFYLIVFAVVNAYFLVKLFLYKLLGSVFSQRETTSELVFNMMLFNNVLGLVLLPVATIHAMVPGFGMVSLFLVPGVIVLFYLMSIIRSIYFAIREGISIFYLILYLCALEILPILLVTKMAVSA
jgi:hypothetical protein